MCAIRMLCKSRICSLKVARIWFVAWIAAVGPDAPLDAATAEDMAPEICPWLFATWFCRAIDCCTAARVWVCMVDNLDRMSLTVCRFEKSVGYWELRAFC